MSASKPVVFSGMRPTGRLHIGNYWGALKNWVGLMDRYECFYSVVDWHMLTTGYEDTAKLQENIREMVLDWLAAGLDPEKCVIFKQSAVPEHAELALLLGMVTPLSWLENCPTWKEQLQELSRTKHSQIAKTASQKGVLLASPGIKVENVVGIETNPETDQSLRTFGFLGYPVLQAADILLYRGQKVPVGQDQLPHLELSREIARKFNSLFGKVFPEPQPLLTTTPKVPGTDGRKMSKSYANAVDIYETAESLKAKAMGMYTDPAKARAADPGHPEPCPENPPGCSVYSLHKLYSPADFTEKRGGECRRGELGCVACKKDLLKHLEPPFAEFRARREFFAGRPGLVENILEGGARRAQTVARETMRDIRRAMRLR